MTEILIGIGLSVITQIAKKSKIDAKIIILVLSIVAGGIYYFFKTKYPDIWEEIVQYTLWVYGISQIVYNYGISFFEKEK